VKFPATAVDDCCTNVTLIYNPPTNTCFPLYSTTPVRVMAVDSCGNVASNSFLVTVLPGPNCGNTNCISIEASNIVVYTCAPCTPVPFTATAIDTCCPGSAVNLEYFPSTNTCFPLNSTTPVQIVAYDQCGNITTNYITVTVNPYPNCPPTNCLTIDVSNVVVYTCSNCTTVPFGAIASDYCCPNVTLFYNPPTNTCFPLNTTTPVQVVGFDACGNAASNSFTVTVLQAATCGPTNCISIEASNIVVYTCSNCTTVPFNATATDFCCPASGVTLEYSPSTNTCFPLNSTTPVQIVAYDQCGNAATNDITVTVLQAAGCGPTNCLSIEASNIVWYTCSNCTTVRFHAKAVDYCCTNVILEYYPGTNTCFPLNSTTPVGIVAYDDCGNAVTNVITVTVLPGPNCGGSGPRVSITGFTNPTGSSTNNISISWPGDNGQVQESSDMLNWSSIPGATSSPYVISNTLPTKFYRLQYH